MVVGGWRIGGGGRAWFGVELISHSPDRPPQRLSDPHVLVQYTSDLSGLRTIRHALRIRLDVDALGIGR